MVDAPRRRRVLVYRDQFLAPSETFVRDHLLGLHDYEPVVAAGFVTDEPLAVPGVPVVELRRTGQRRRVLDGLARRAGAEEPEIRVRQLRRVVRDVRPDVVHAHFGIEGAVAQRALAGTGVPLVVTFHGWDASTYPDVMRGYGGFATHLVERWDDLVAGADAIIAVSETIKSLLVDRGADESKIQVIACGVDTASFPLAEPSPDGPVVFVGRLVEKKGVADLLEALALVSHAPHLHVYGDGPLRADLERLAVDRGVNARFFGMTSTEDVRRAFESAAVVAMPSRRARTGDLEGLGVVALEAAARGKVVVGYRSGGLAEAVLSGETGHLVEEGDIPGLADALRSVFRDPAGARQMGTAARRHVVERFEQAALLARVEDVYDEVLAAQASRSGCASAR